MDKSRVDTKEGIERYLKDGISGLHQLGRDRREVTGYGKNRMFEERLNEWVLLGHWYLDSIGNISTIHEGFIDGAERVVLYREFFTSYGVRTISSSHQRFPEIGDLCPQCLNVWELRNLHDHRLVRVDEVIEAGPGFRFYHPECHSLKLVQESMKQYREIFHAAGLSAVELRPIRNEYGSDSYRGVWAFAETPAGLIRIGWRKRVIEIDWSRCRLTRDPDFSKEDVTKEAALIHAWGSEKAVEYIRKILACSQ